jgi:hypothetical protein
MVVRSKQWGWPGTWGWGLNQSDSGEQEESGEIDEETLAQLAKLFRSRMFL